MSICYSNTNTDGLSSQYCGQATPSFLILTVFVTTESYISKSDHLQSGIIERPSQTATSQCSWKISFEISSI